MNHFLTRSKDLLSRPQQSILSAAMVIAATYGVSMVLGIFRERLLVARFYSCCRDNLDVYYAAFRLPDMIFQLVVIGALSAAFIPVFSERVTKGDQSDSFASSVINILMLFFLILCLVIIVFAYPLCQLIARGFSPQQLTLMAQMTRVMLVAQVFFLISNFSSGIIQSGKRFLLPSLSPIIYNLSIIISIFCLSPFFGIWSAVIGVISGALFHLLIQLPLLRKLNFHYQLRFDWHDSDVRKVFRLMLPRTLSLAANQVEATVALFLATSLPAGSLTIYYLAQRLADLPVRILGTSVGQAALPTLSSQIARNQKDELKSTLSRSLNQIFFFSMLVTGLFLVLRVQLVRFAYGAKSFPWEATIQTGKTMAAVALAILPQSGIQLLARAFYAFHDTQIPFLISLLSVITNVGLSFYFVYVAKMGTFGLALAYSISNYLNWLLLLTAFHLKRLPYINRELIVHWMATVVIALLSSTLAWATMKLLDIYALDTTKALPVIALTLLSLAVGLLSYLLMAKILGFPEIDHTLTIVKKLLRLGKSMSQVDEIINPHPEATSGL